MAKKVKAAKPAPNVVITPIKGKVITVIGPDGLPRHKTV